MSGPAAAGTPATRMVELVGPAGAGKSTVFEELLARDGRIEGRPTLRSTEYVAVFARELASALATVLRRGALRPRVTREQIRMMGYLQALPQILDRAPFTDVRTIVFDQGPVYLLTRASLRNERLEPWRQRLLATWAPLLDLVVWLDAPDELLSERINSRSKWHALKGAPSRTAVDVLTTSRAVYEGALAELAGQVRGPLILRFDTSRCSAGEIAAEVLAALAGARSAQGGRGLSTTTDRLSGRTHGE